MTRSQSWDSDALSMIYKAQIPNGAYWLTPFASGISNRYPAASLHRAFDVPNDLDDRP